MRLRAYRIIILAFFVLLFLGLFFIQGIRGHHYYSLSLRNFIRLIPESPYRGRVFDRDERLLVDNVLSFDVVVTPQELRDKEGVLGRLAEHLFLPEEFITTRYERGVVNPFTPVVLVRDITKTQAIRLEEERLDLAGVSVVLNTRRSYPRGTVASHLLGYLGQIDKSRITKLKGYGYDIRDTVGYSGLEEQFDGYLRGRKGGRQIEVDNRGRQVRLLGYRPPQAGQDIRLSIDLVLQQICDRRLRGRKGAVVVLDVDSGEIVAMSSSPPYDPNVFIARSDLKRLNFFLTSLSAPLFNRAISGQFPPASVFKVITALAALEAGKATASTTFVCAGKLVVGTNDFRCWTVHGSQDFYQAMSNSCDVYFYQLGLAVGPDALANMAREFGLHSLTGIDLPGEAKGFIPSPLWKRLSRFEGWYGGDTANFSIGQGYVLATPLQLARMMAAVANGTHLPASSLVEAIGGRESRRGRPKRIDLGEDSLRLLRESLRYVVSRPTGTAHLLDIPGLDICAKTGTAEVTGGRPHGLVAGFFPYDAPRFAFCVLLENVGTSYYACGLARDIFQEALGEAGGVVAALKKKP